MRIIKKGDNFIRNNYFLRNVEKVRKKKLFFNERKESKKNNNHFHEWP